MFGFKFSRKLQFLSCSKGGGSERELRAKIFSGRRSGRSQEEGENNYSSHLVVKSSGAQQSGQYHCAANPGESNKITVHVHHGKLLRSS